MGVEMPGKMRALRSLGEGANTGRLHGGGGGWFGVVEKGLEGVTGGVIVVGSGSFVSVSANVGDGLGEWRVFVVGD